MNHVEFNKRYATLKEVMAEAEAAPPSAYLCGDHGGFRQGWAQEAYDLLQELPPASDRAAELRRILKVLEPYEINVSPTSAAARKLAAKEAKLRPEQRATRGRTFKAHPTDRAMGALQAANASYNAHRDAVQAARATLKQAEADFAAAYTKLIAAAEAAQALKPARGGSSKAPSAPAQSTAKATPKAKAATPKGQLSPAMAMVLEAVACGVTEVNGLTSQQFSAARMHLAMRGWVAKNAKGEYRVTRPE